MIRAFFRVASRIIAPFGMGPKLAKWLGIGAILTAAVLWHQKQVWDLKKETEARTIAQLERNQDEIDSIADEARERAANDIINNGLRGDNLCRDCDRP